MIVSDINYSDTNIARALWNSMYVQKHNIGHRTE